MLDVTGFNPTEEAFMGSSMGQYTKLFYYIYKKQGINF